MNREQQAAFRQDEATARAIVQGYVARLAILPRPNSQRVGIIGPNAERLAGANVAQSSRDSEALDREVSEALALIRETVHRRAAVLLLDRLQFSRTWNTIAGIRGWHPETCRDTYREAVRAFVAELERRGISELVTL